MEGVVLITCVGCAPAICIINALKNKCEGKYNIIGVDIVDICPGRHIVDKFYNVPKITNDDYYGEIYDICSSEKVNYVFVTNEIELSWWASNKFSLEYKLGLKIFCNSIIPESLCGNKFLTSYHCKNNNILVPNELKINDQRFNNSNEMIVNGKSLFINNDINFPLISKPFNGAGSNGIQIIPNKYLLANYLEKLILENNLIINYLFQELISGTEYTVDVALIDREIVAVVPKQRLEIKNGQATKSETIKDDDVINFAINVVKTFFIEHTCNVQIIKCSQTRKLYLIEINAKFASSLALTVEAGVNIPKILIDSNKNNKYDFKNGVIMVRCHREFYFTTGTND